MVKVYRNFCTVRISQGSVETLLKCAGNS